MCYQHLPMALGGGLWAAEGQSRAGALEEDDRRSSKALDVLGNF